jgi:hypothetical protein
LTQLAGQVPDRVVGLPANSVRLAGAPLAGAPLAGAFKLAAEAGMVRGQPDDGDEPAPTCARPAPFRTERDDAPVGVFLKEKSGDVDVFAMLTG